MDTSRSTGWEYAEPVDYKVIDTHVHVWETDGVMSAHSGVYKDTPHATPGLRSAPPSWSSEPTDSGRVELLLEDMERCGVDGAVLVQTSFSTWNNEYVAAAALRFPSRCRSMGMVDPLVCITGHQIPSPLIATYNLLCVRVANRTRRRSNTPYTGWTTGACRDFVFIHHIVRQHRMRVAPCETYSNQSDTRGGTDHTGVASDRPGMDRSVHASGSPVHGEILKLPHNEGLFDAIQQRGGIVQLHSPQPEILQVDYAARKWPGITWLLDHMSVNSTSSLTHRMTHTCESVLVLAC